MSWHRQPHDDSPQTRPTAQGTCTQVEILQHLHTHRLSKESMPRLFISSTAQCQRWRPAFLTVSSHVYMLSRDGSIADWSEGGRLKGPSLGTKIVRYIKGRHFDTKKSSRRDYVDLLFDASKLSVNTRRSSSRCFDVGTCIFEVGLSMSRSRSDNALKSMPRLGTKRRSRLGYRCR